VTRAAVLRDPAIAGDGAFDVSKIVNGQIDRLKRKRGPATISNARSKTPSFRDISSATRFRMRWRLTGRLGRRDSNLCISKSDLLNFIPPQRVLGVDRARL
jgi:hypothetical protein